MTILQAFSLFLTCSPCAMSKALSSALCQSSDGDFDEHFRFAVQFVAKLWFWGKKNHWDRIFDRVQSEILISDRVQSKILISNRIRSEIFDHKQFCHNLNPLWRKSQSQNRSEYFSNRFSSVKIWSWGFFRLKTTVRKSVEKFCDWFFHSQFWSENFPTKC